MVTLLQAATDSERTFRESLLSVTQMTAPIVSDFAARYKRDKRSVFESIKNIPLHQNPLLKHTGGRTSDNGNVFESKGGEHLTRAEIEEFYEKGFVSRTFKLSSSENDLQRILREVLDCRNKAQRGAIDRAYSRFPDYVGQLYIPGIIKLLKDNYDSIVQKSMGVFNAPEEELFFAVGVFLVDETEKGINVHQDYSYYPLDQLEPELCTSLITFHTAISNPGASRFQIYPGTNKEILHTLPVLRYLAEHDIPIDEAMAASSGGLAEFLAHTGRLPYEDPGTEFLSHVSRYPQMVYVLDKYKHADVQGYEVNTAPGEFVLFDPGTLHSNGASSASLDDLVKSASKELTDANISRLSLAIRVMRGKNARGHMLWTAALEKVDVLQKFFEGRAEENAAANPKVEIGKNVKEFYTVLSNDKVASPDSPYFSIREIYDLHARSGAYSGGGEPDRT